MADAPAPDAQQLVHRISERLQAVADTARAAESCAAAGNLDGALAMLADLEPALYDLMTLLNAASILRDDRAQ